MVISTAVIVYLSLSFHMYLKSYYSRGTLPRVYLYRAFTIMEGAMILHNSIWFFGWIPGIAICAGLFFLAGTLTVPVSGVLYCVGSQTDLQRSVLGERPSRVVCILWGAIVCILVGLTEANYELMPFASLRDSLSGTAFIVIIIGLALTLYLIIGLKSVASDHCRPFGERPLYVLDDSVHLDILQIVFWPLPRISLRLQERRWRQAQNNKQDICN